MLRSNDGSILVATIDMGVLRFEPASGAMLHFDRSLVPERCRVVQDLLPGAWRLFQDGDDVWIGLNTNGLALWSARNNRHRSTALPIAESKQRNEFVLSLTRDAATGRILALTNERGLFVFESDGRLAGRLPMPEGRGRYRAQHITAIGDGRAWVSTDRHLLLADLRGLNWLAPPFPTGAGSCTSWLWWTVADNDGNLWCYDDEEQLSHLNTSTGRCEALFDRLPALRNMIGGPINSALVDASGRLWIAPRDNPPLVIPIDGRAIQLPAPGDRGLFRINSFSTGDHGSVLAATREHGAVTIDLLPDGTPRYSRIDRGSDDGPHEVQDIVAMSDGSFWIDERSALVRIDPATGQEHQMSAKDGLPGNDFRFEQGNGPLPSPLLIGVWEGIIAIDPAVADLKPPPPRVQIPAFFAADSLLAREVDLVLGDPIRLRHDQDRVVFELRSTNLADPERDLFAYRLIGLDSSWNLLPPQDRITFSSLAPGRYQLEAKARTNGGAWGPVTHVAFTILPPFWATWWFRALLIMAMALLAWSAFRMVLRIRLSRQRRQMERERAVLEERVRIAHDLHDDLGSGLATIGMESELAVLEAKDPAAREVLRRVSEGARNVGDDMRRIVWAMSSGQETLGDLVAYVRGFTGEMLEQAGVEFNFHQRMANPALVLSVDQRKHIVLFCKEAVHNVVKHANAANVRLHMEQDGSRLRITIADDGVGFDMARADGKGTGSASMRERAAALRAGMDLESAPDLGTRIVLTIPLP
jgi:signal transduction histidine kinase